MEAEEQPKVQNVPCPLSQVLVSAPNDHPLVPSYTCHLHRIQTGILGHVHPVGSSHAMGVTPVQLLLLEGRGKKGGMLALENVLLSAGLHPNSSSCGCKAHIAHKVISTV